MDWTVADALRWTEHGTELLDRQVSLLTEFTACQPSALPGWTRKHLIAHVSGNADALGNLVRWAATGEPTPMYTSPQQRQADIDSGATMPLHQLLGWFGRSATTLARQLDHLTPMQWRAEVVTAQGRKVPATTIPWLRAREVLVHAVDLGTGLAFADLPSNFLLALSADIITKRNAPSPSQDDRRPVILDAPDVDVRFEITGTGRATTVQGVLADVTAFLAGRSFEGELVNLDGGPLPNLPAWL